MTLAEFAVAMEMNEGYLSELENGKRRYNQDILERAAKILGVPAAHLIYRKPVPSAPRLKDYEDPAIVAAAIADLSADDRRKLARIIMSYHQPTDE